MFQISRYNLSLLRATWKWVISRQYAEIDPAATLSVPKERK